MRIKILYEDKNLLVIDKPSGIAVHPDGKSKEKTISDWFVTKYPKAKNVGEPINIESKGKVISIAKSGIVHRLDKDTSGVLLLAKNQDTFLFLKDQFENREVEKVYRAFVYGSMKNPIASLASGGMGLINSPIGRSPNDVRMWTAGRGARPPVKQASTAYQILARFEDKGEKYTYIEARPKTGRTHQIRVHMRYINHPIVSDSLYAGSKGKALGMKRIALHALSLSFFLPNGERQKIEAPLPEDFKKVEKKYKITNLAK